jgi:hypothetical protein
MNKEELLIEAQKRYPKGTKYKSAYNLQYESVSNGVFRQEMSGISCFNDKGDNYFVYYKDRWAEIISKPELKVEDLIEGENELAEHEAKLEFYKSELESLQSEK